MQLFLELHLGDFTRETAHWEPARVGWYVRLLMAYYRLEGPIGHSDRYACVGARVKADRVHVDAVLAEVFERKGDVWLHVRSEADIAKRSERSEKARESIGKRWERLRRSPVVGEEGNRERRETRERHTNECTNEDTNVLPTKNGRNTPHLTTLPSGNPPKVPLSGIGDRGSGVGELRHGESVVVDGRRWFRWRDQVVDSARDFFEFCFKPGYPKGGSARYSAEARELLAELWDCEGFEPGRLMRGLAAYSAKVSGEDARFTISMAKFVGKRVWEDFPDDTLPSGEVRAPLVVASADDVRAAYEASGVKW